MANKNISSKQLQNQYQRKFNKNHSKKPKINKTDGIKSVNHNLNNAPKKKLTKEEYEILKAKKRRMIVLKSRIILGIVIVVLILIITLLIKIFDFVFSKDIQNIWAIDINNNICYLELKDNKASISNDSITFYGTYEIKDNNIININIKDDTNEIIFGDYYYTFKGSALTGKKLILVKVTDNDQNRKQLTLYESERPRSISPFDSFVADKRFTGNWIVKDLNYTYSFSDDGYLILTMDNMSIEAVYFINNNLVEVKYLANGNIITYSFLYSFNDDVLFINNQSLYNYK